MEEKRCRRRSSITDAAIPDVEELEELHCPPSLAQAPHKLVGRWIIAETFGLGLTLSFQKELWSLFYDSHHVVAFTTGGWYYKPAPGTGDGSFVKNPVRLENPPCAPNLSLRLLAPLRSLCPCDTWPRA